MNVRRCSRCYVFKPPTDFYKDGRRAGGIRAECRECFKAIMRPRSRRHYRDHQEWYLARSARRAAARKSAKRG